MQCSFDPPLADSSSCHLGVCKSLHMMPFTDFSGSEPTLHNVSAEIGHMLHTKGTRKPFTHALHKREVKKILWWHVLDVLQAHSVITAVLHTPGLLPLIDHLPQVRVHTPVGLATYMHHQISVCACKADQM